MKLLRAERIELTVRRPVTNALDVAHLAGELTTAGAGDVEEKLAEGVAGRSAADTTVGGTSLSGEDRSVRRLGKKREIGRTHAVHRLLQVRDRRLRNVVRRLAEEGMNEIGSSERAGNERRARTSGGLDPRTVSDMAVDLRVTETEETQFAPVRVGGEVLEGVKKGAEKTVGFVRCRLAAAVASAPAELDALDDTLADKLRGGLPAALLVCDVVLSGEEE